MTIQNAINQMLESVGRVAGATKLIKTAEKMPTKEDVEKWSTQAKAGAEKQVLADARGMSEKYIKMAKADRSSLEGLRRLNERSDTLTRQRSTVKLYDRFGDVINGGGSNG